jgi:protein tyrosine phosphatase
VTSLRVTRPATTEVKLVQHFWYTAWPDHGVPSKISSLLHRSLRVLTYLVVKICVCVRRFLLLSVCCGLDNTSGVLECLHGVRKAMSGRVSPIVIHCSAGIGRSGAFMAAYIAMTEIQNQWRSFLPYHCPSSVKRLFFLLTAKTHVAL